MYQLYRDGFTEFSQKKQKKIDYIFNSATFITSSFGREHTGRKCCFSADISNVSDIDNFGDRIISYSPPPFFSKIQYVSSVITVNSEVKIVNI